MTDSTRTAVIAKASSELYEVSLQLREIAKHLIDGNDRAALGALSGLATQIQSTEVLLRALQGLRPADPSSKAKSSQV